MSTTRQQAEEAVRKLQRYRYELGRNIEKFLDYAAVPIVQAGQQFAPVGRRVHKRYSTPKVNKGLRAPKGLGRVVATYAPGNLRGSVRTLKFRRAIDAVFVGPKLARGGSTGSFGPARPDGYYAHMIEKGTVNSSARPFMAPAARIGLPLAYKRLETAARLFTEKFANR